jgi:ABC-type sulfate transport system permease component
MILAGIYLSKSKKSRTITNCIGIIHKALIFSSYCNTFSIHITYTAFFKFYSSLFSYTLVAFQIPGRAIIKFALDPPRGE